MTEALEQKNDDVPQGRHHLGSRAFADPARVLFERAIADPVQPVLDPPVTPSHLKDLRGPGPRPRQAHDPVLHLHFHPVAGSALTLQPVHLPATRPVPL